MRLLAISCLVGGVGLAVGCASANVDPSGNPDGPRVDARPNDDAPTPVDAAPSPVTLTQTGSNTVAPTKIGCQQNNPATGFTTPNSYYRIFPLADSGITKPFQVKSVTFAVEQSTPGNGVSQPATLNIGTYGGVVNAASFPQTQLTKLATAAIQIPLNAPSVTTPIATFNPATLTVPAASNFYVEVAIPDGRLTSNTLYLGSNAGTETHPSYIFATDCMINSPTSYDTAVGTPLVRLLITVDGEF